MNDYRGSLSKEKVRQVIDRQEKFSIDATGYISQAWDMVQKDQGNYIGFGAVSMLISGAVGVIPYIGNILSGLVSAVLNPGFYIFSFKKKYDQHPDFNTFFEGTKHTGALIAELLIVSLISIIAIAPAGIIFAFSVDWDTGMLNDPSGLMIGLMAIFGLIAFVILFYLTVSWIFAPQFIIFADMGPWEAMEASRKLVAPNFGEVFILLILTGLLTIAGLLLCCIGLFWAIPTVQTTNFLVFDDIFKLGEEMDETDSIIEHLL
ncbi:MAG: hypothetical protein ACI94Y_002508 [Maribacter sp.]|jgi:hypothetical protein